MMSTVYVIFALCSAFGSVNAVTTQFPHGKNAERTKENVKVLIGSHGNINKPAVEDNEGEDETFGKDSLEPLLDGSSGEEKATKTKAAAPPPPDEETLEPTPSSTSSPAWQTKDVMEPKVGLCGRVDSSPGIDVQECPCAFNLCGDMWACFEYRKTNAQDASWGGQCDRVESKSASFNDEECCTRLLEPCKNYNPGCYDNITLVGGYFPLLRAGSAGLKVPVKGKVAILDEAGNNTGAGDGSSLDEAILDKRAC